MQTVSQNHEAATARPRQPRVRRARRVSARPAPAQSQIPVVRQAPSGRRSRACADARRRRTHQTFRLSRAPARTRRARRQGSGPSVPPAAAPRGSSRAVPSEPVREDRTARRVAPRRPTAARLAFSARASGRSATVQRLVEQRRHPIDRMRMRVAHDANHFSPIRAADDQGLSDGSLVRPIEPALR
jgi:hypothetical protein